MGSPQQAQLPSAVTKPTKRTRPSKTQASLCSTTKRREHPNPRERTPTRLLLVHLVISPRRTRTVSQNPKRNPTSGCFGQDLSCSLWLSSVAPSTTSSSWAKKDQKKTPSLKPWTRSKSHSKVLELQFTQIAGRK